jgi:KDO2-lipid IV(A) lauroyltransferase
MSSVEERLSSIAYSVGWSVVRRMPEKSAYAMFERIADTMWARQGKDVTRLQSNLRRVVGPAVSDDDLKLLGRAGMRTYFRYWCELFRMPSWSEQRIRDDMVVINDHYVTQALAEGNGLIIVCPHMGNWDHAGYWVKLQHGWVTTVVERLKPEDLFQKFIAVRVARGIDIIPLTGGEPAYPYLVNRIKEGRLVALAADRDLSNSGVRVQFFGSTAKMPAGPAALHVDTGAPIMAAAVFTRDGRNYTEFFPRLEIVPNESRMRSILTITQQIAHTFEGIISDHPEDWHMLQRVWLDDLDPQKADAIEKLADE